MFKIYWTDADGRAQAQDETLLTQALAVVKARRDEGHRFVTMVSEDPAHVGKPGVDAVVDGKTPDGQTYDWSKAGRAGKPRRGDKIIGTREP